MPSMQHTAGVLDYGQSAMNGVSPNTYDANQMAYPFPTGMDMAPPLEEPSGGQYWNMDAGVFGSGLNLSQQEELMHSLETDGMEDIQSMISSTLAALAAKAPVPRTI